MYTPSELEKMPIELERRMSDLEMRIMEDIVRRININDEITRSADWQIYRFQQMGQSTEYIKEQIQTALKLSDTDIDNLYDGAIQSGYVRDEGIYEAVGKAFVPFRGNAELQQLIQATILQTKSQMVNITQTLGFMVDMGNKTVFTPLSQYYQQILDNAVLEVITGAFDYNTSLKRIVNQMTKSGLRTVDYASGLSNRVEVAARKALMTGVTQVTGQVNEMNAKELGTDSFEVSWHGSARPSHQEWQGKVFTKAELASVCGLGSVTGLCGANCYHSYYPFIPGISERTYTGTQLKEMNTKENTPKTYNGKEYTTYEAAQRQRQLETLMRKQRQDIKLLKGGNVAEDDLINAQAKYRGTMAQYKNFSEKMELPQQRERIYVDGLGKVTSEQKPLVNAVRNRPKINIPTNKNGDSITFDLGSMKEEKQSAVKESITTLSREYKTNLTNITKGGTNAGVRGDTDVTGSAIRLSTGRLPTVYHEFAHTLSNSKWEKFKFEVTDSDFWKEIKSVRRNYTKAINERGLSIDGKNKIFISNYAEESVDEFMSECFARAKLDGKIDFKDTEYSDHCSPYAVQVLNIIDKYFKYK